MSTLPYRVLVNSLPKSGTHLLTQAVAQFGYQEYASQRNYWDRCLSMLGYGTPWLLNHRQAKQSRQRGRISATTQAIQVGALTEYSVSAKTMYDWLSQLKLGCYIQGHLPYSPALLPVLDELKFRHVLIIRDPRAVLVSLLHYIPNAHRSGMGKHFLADDFAKLNSQQQLDLLLYGGEAKCANLIIKPFAEVFFSVLQWRESTQYLMLYFEDIIGPQGGGDSTTQQRVLHQLAMYLNPQTDTHSLTDIYNPHSRTFRQGQVDGWQKGLSPQWIQQLNDYCAPLCAALNH